MEKYILKFTHIEIFLIETNKYTGNKIKQLQGHTASKLQFSKIAHTPSLRSQFDIREREMTHQ